MLELHRKILGDKGRNDAFYRALKALIVPGQSIVCDIGAGTGFLSFLAQSLSAKECYLFEQQDILLLAREIAHLNHIEHCHFIAQHSGAYTGKIAADILVSETLGNYALEENIIESIEDGKRFLKPGGKTIPEKIDQYICPVVNPRIHSELNVWDTIGYGLNFQPAKEVALNNMYVYSIRQDDLLNDRKAIQCWDRIDFTQSVSSVRKATMTWRYAAPMTIYGCALWWNALLAPDINISTSPLDAPTHWQQIYLPFLEPLSVDCGEKMVITLESDTTPAVKVRLTWQTVIWSEDGHPKHAVHMDTQRGLL